MSVLVNISNLSKSYHKTEGVVRVLEDASLQIMAGEFVTVRGPSGCGKTTLLLIAGGLLAPNQGTVKVDGQDLYLLPSESRAMFRASKIGFVFQQFHLIPYFNVLDNVLSPSLAAATPHPRKRAGELISRFGLSDRIRHVPAELSTGERQRTALARALFNSPKLLLADEPTGNLDDENSMVVLDCMTDFARSGGAVLMVSHDAAAAGRSDRVIAIKNGKLE